MSIKLNQTIVHSRNKAVSAEFISEIQNAIEVARRQPDGTWHWLIGDPFTVGRRDTAWYRTNQPRFFN